MHRPRFIFRTIALALVLCAALVPVSSADWSNGYYTQSATQVPTGLMLDKAEIAARRSGGSWSSLFDRGALFNQHPVLAATALYVFVSVLGWLMWPVAFSVLPALADRGLFIAKTLALLMGGAGIWFFASTNLMKFDRFHVGLWLIVLICISLFAGWRQRTLLNKFLRLNRGLALQGEILFLVVFVTALTIRWQNPDLWDPRYGGEKPMDFAFLNAVLKSGYFPPYDPWFSGGYINYFYFGFVLAAMPTLFIGIIPEVAYHLAGAMFFALAACGVFGVTYTLAANTRHPRTAALLAVFMVLSIGNLGQLQLASERILDGGSVQTAPRPAVLTTIRLGASALVQGNVDFQYPGHRWFWDATRIIPSGEGEAGPITEFPYFTFLYGDLHAHFMALPLTLLILCMALGWWYRTPLNGYEISTSWPLYLGLALGGMVLGALRMTNTWDIPTYLGLALLAFVASVFAGEKGNRFRQLTLGLTVLAAAYMVFTFPFESAFSTGYTKLLLWHGSRTTLSSYLLIHGIFLFPILSLLWLQRREFFGAWNLVREVRPMTFALFWFVCGILIVILIATSLVFMPILVIAVPLAVPTAAMLMRSGTSRMDRAWAAMVLCGTLLTILVETVSLHGDSGRMNSVFKAYYQVWVLWGICAAVASTHIWSRNPKRLSLRTWQAVWVLLVCGGLAYTILATPARNQQRFDRELGGGLNGAAYMETARHSENGQEFRLQWDHDAIEWLQDNVNGTPVIAEGRSIHEYLWGNRISVYTGLPTILGWRHHQIQQRSILPAETIDRRARDVDALYSDEDPQTALRIINQYGVDLIYAGPLERTRYTEAGLAKFDFLLQRGILEILYRNPGVTIYLASPSGELPEARTRVLNPER